MNFRKIVIGALGCLATLGLSTCVFMKQPQFGQLPSGKRLEAMKRSPRFKDGRFHNLQEKPTIGPGYSFIGEIYKTLFKDHPRREPKDPLPSVKTDLKNLPADQDLAVWFGHSSVYIQIGGIRFLVDPNFSGKATPLRLQNGV